MTWDDDAQRWTIVTDRGDRLASKFVVIAGGVLHKAKLPGIPGIETFQGQTFHTSRWDYAYTGGGPDEPMDKLDDKVVGIIGTGATAVQVVPAAGPVGQAALRLPAHARRRWASATRAPPTPSGSRA